MEKKRKERPPAYVLFQKPSHDARSEKEGEKKSLTGGYALGKKKKGRKKG